MGRNHHFGKDFRYIGEMEFRSNQFLNEFETSTGGFNSINHNHRDPYATHGVGSISDQLSSMYLLHPKPRTIPSLPSSLQSSRPYGPISDQRLYRGSPNLEPFYELLLSRIRENESQQERTRVLLRQEALLHKTGLVHRNGNALRGTGVFHPLQRPNTNTFNSDKKHSDKRNQFKSENELLAKEKREVMTSAPREEQQQKDECYYHLPLDLDFSKELSDGTSSNNN